MYNNVLKNTSNPFINHLFSEKVHGKVIIVTEIKHADDSVIYSMLVTENGKEHTYRSNDLQKLINEGNNLSSSCKNIINQKIGFMKQYTRADIPQLKPKIKASEFDNLRLLQFLRVGWWAYFNHARFSRFLHGIDSNMSAVVAYEYAKQFKK